MTRIIGSFAVLIVLALPNMARADWRVAQLPVDPGKPFSFSEPGVTAGDDGLVIANASTANSGSPATFWLSRDGGAHWTAGAPWGGAVSTGDSDTAVGPGGRLYSLVLGYGSSPPAQPSNPAVLVFRSRDGAHWSGPATFPPPHGADQPDRPWLVVTRSAVLVFNSEGGGNVVVWRSTDHGATFHGPVPVTGGANAQAGLALGSRPLVDPVHPSRLRLFYETAAGAAPAVGLSQVGDLASTLLGERDEPGDEFPLTQLWMASSGDGGRTWSNRLIYDAGAATLGHLLPAPAIDTAGGLYVVLSLRRAGATPTRLVLLHSVDGVRWSAPAPIPTGMASNVMPALAAAAPGHVFVSFYASDAADFSDAKARWSELVASSADARAAHPRFALARLGGDAPVHVGGVDSAGAVGNDAGADWALRDFQGIAVDACGRPHVVWASDAGAPRTLTATTNTGCRRKFGAATTLGGP